MRNFIKIDPLGELQTCIETSNVSTLDNQSLIEIKDLDLWNKLKEKPFYFKYVNSVLLEKNDQDKKIEDDKRLVKNSDINIVSRLTKIEDRLTILEQIKK